MPKILREEDISAGLRAPLYSITTRIPECNVCIYRIKPGECEKVGVPSDEIRFGNHRDCPHAVLVPGRMQDVCQEVRSFS